jgi:hypothetical protein
MMEPLAAFGKSQSKTNLSTSVSLSILDRNGTEIPLETTMDNPFKIIIPRDPNLIIPPMILHNISSSNSIPHHQLFHLHYVNITNTLPMSVHFQIHPLETNLSYLFIYKFDQLPLLNTSLKRTDGWNLFCPSRKFDLISTLIDICVYRFDE